MHPHRSTPTFCMAVELFGRGIAMRTIREITAGIFAGLMVAIPALASAENACLQQNRAWSWRPVDDKTLIYSDRQGNDYTVTFSNSCRNLTRGDVTLVNRHWSGLRCLSSGDS